jgi:hypothetical protein
VESRCGRPENAKLFEALSRTITLDSNGAAEVVFTTTKTIDVPGYYVWQENTVAAPTMAARMSTFGRISETQIDHQPKLDSRASQQYVKAGVALTDTVTVTGGVRNRDLPVWTTVYGPLSAQPAGESTTVPAGTPVFEKLATKTVTLDGDGKATVVFTTSKKVTQPGYYVFREESGETAHHHAAQSTYGRGRETTVLVTANVTSQVSAQEAHVGDLISDTVVVSGLQPISGFALPRITLTGRWDNRPIGAAK